MRPYHTPTPQHLCDTCHQPFTPDERSKVHLQPGTIATIAYTCPTCAALQAARRYAYHPTTYRRKPRGPLKPVPVQRDHRGDLVPAAAR